MPSHEKKADDNRLTDYFCRPLLAHFSWTLARMSSGLYEAKDKPKEKND